MNHISSALFAGRKLIDGLNTANAGGPINQQSRPHWLGRLRSSIAGPFHRSIYVRFQYVFGLALLGLVLMAGITMVSGNILLKTFENSAADSHFDMVALHGIQESLRQTEHLAYLYAVEGDQSAPHRFKGHQEAANRHFRELADNELQSEARELPQSHMSLAETERAWQSAEAAMLMVFEQPPGSAEATNALVRAHVAINPVHTILSAFLASSMRDLDESLTFAKSVAGWAHAALFGAILIGLGTLIIVGRVVGRSVLQPIGGLQEAARKLGKKDFSHRVRLRNTKDELGQLAKAFNIASATLQRSFLELKRRSTHDGLTGAINRGEFEQRLIAECASADRRNRPLGLLLVDVDFFKRINDTYGHPAGDRALKAVARLLNETMRPGDLVARYGGEEFAIILPEGDEESAVATAERLRSTIERTCIDCGNGVDINITVSVGCACRWPFAMTTAEFVEAADTALYLAKEAGRNRVVSAGKPAVHGQQLKSLPEGPEMNVQNWHPQ